jgi:hypothetical protein
MTVSSKGGILDRAGPAAPFYPKSTGRFDWSFFVREYKISLLLYIHDAFLSD